MSRRLKVISGLWIGALCLLVMGQHAERDWYVGAPVGQHRFGVSHKAVGSAGADTFKLLVRPDIVPTNGWAAKDSTDEDGDPWMFEDAYYDVITEATDGTAVRYGSIRLSVPGVPRYNTNGTITSRTIERDRGHPAFATMMAFNVGALKAGDRVENAWLMFNGQRFGGGLDLSTGYIAARLDTVARDYHMVYTTSGDTVDQSDPMFMNTSYNEVSRDSFITWQAEPTNALGVRDDWHEYGITTARYAPGYSVEEEGCIRLDVSDAIQLLLDRGNPFDGWAVFWVYTVGTPDASFAIGASNTTTLAPRGNPALSVTTSSRRGPKAWGSVHTPIILTVDDTYGIHSQYLDIFTAAGGRFSEAASGPGWGGGAAYLNAAQRDSLNNSSLVDIMMHSATHTGLATLSNAAIPDEIARAWYPAGASAPRDTSTLVDFAWPGAGAGNTYTMRAMKPLDAADYRSARAATDVRDSAGFPTPLGLDGYVNKYLVASLNWRAVLGDSTTPGSIPIEAIGDTLLDFVDLYWADNGRAPLILYGHDNGEYGGFNEGGKYAKVQELVDRVVALPGLDFMDYRTALAYRLNRQTPIDPSSVTVANGATANNATSAAAYDSAFVADSDDVWLRTWYGPFQRSEALAAGFTASTRSGNADLAVDFYETSRGNPTDYYWEFGDGGESSSEDPSYDYEEQGDFSVRLITSRGTVVDTLLRNAYISVNAVPSAPTNLSPTAGDGEVVLDWDSHPDAADDLSYFVIKRATDQNVALYDSTADTTSTYTDAAATNDTEWWYSIRAVDSGDLRSGHSNGVRATPESGADTDPPLPPTGLTAHGGDGEVVLNWTASPSGDVADYNIYRRNAAGSLALFDEGIAAVTYTDATVPNDSTYYYTVSAEDEADNESLQTSEVSAKAVAVTSYSHGDTITITGSGFGTRPMVRELFENFDRDISGGQYPVPVDSVLNLQSGYASSPDYDAGVFSWTNTGAGYYQGNPVYFENRLTRSGSGYTAARVTPPEPRVPGGSGAMNLLAVDGFQVMPGDKVYASCWFRTDMPGVPDDGIDSPHQWKFWNVIGGETRTRPGMSMHWEAGGDDSGTVRTFWFAGDDSDLLHAWPGLRSQTRRPHPVPDVNDAGAGDGPPIDDSVWFNIALEFYAGDDSVANSTLQVWYDSEPGDYESGFISWDGDHPETAANYAAGHLFAGTSWQNYIPWYEYDDFTTEYGYATIDTLLVDDVTFVHGTWARVELSAHSSHDLSPQAAARSPVGGFDHQEIISWADDEIVLVLNAPVVAHPSSSVRYLHVTNDFGVVVHTVQIDIN